MVPAKPSQVHYDTNTDHYAQVHKVSFSLRLKLNEYSRPGHGDSSINMQITGMKENHESTSSASGAGGSSNLGSSSSRGASYGSSSSSNGSNSSSSYGGNVSSYHDIFS